MFQSSFIMWFWRPENRQRQPGKETRQYGRHDAVEIHGRHVDPAHERRVVGEEARDLRHDAARETEGAHVRRAAPVRLR